MTYEVAIGWDNRIDTAILTATNQVASLAVDRLQTPDVREIWRAEQNSVAIRADFGGQSTWAGTALIRSNAIAGDTVRVGLSTTDSTGLARDVYDSGTIDSNVDPVFGMLVHFPPERKVGRHLRIDLTQSEPPEAGRWFAGPIWHPSRAFSYGWRPIWRDSSRRTESIGQTLFIDRKIRQRGFIFSLVGLHEEEHDNQMHELDRVNGTSRDVLICRNLSADNPGKNTIWGLLEQIPGSRQDHPDFYTVDFEHYERI